MNNGNNIRVFYSILDSKLARWITLKVFPKLRSMPSLKTAIAFEIRVDDINSWNYDMNDGLMTSIMDDNKEDNNNIKFRNIDTVRIKIFATKQLNIKPDYINSGCSIDGAQFLNEPIATNLIGTDEHNNNPSTYPIHHIDDCIDDDLNDSSIGDSMGGGFLGNFLYYLNGVN